MELTLYLNTVQAPWTMAVVLYKMPAKFHMIHVLQIKLTFDHDYTDDKIQNTLTSVN